MIRPEKRLCVGRGDLVMAEALGELQRTHRCGEVRREHASQRVVLMGWVHRRRDHGGLIFIDLRDREGMVQVVFNPQIAAEAHAKASRLRSEYVIAVAGAVAERPAGTANATLATGDVEIVAADLTILSEANPLPFALDSDEEISEALRLKYRYLDLRRPHVQHNLIVRHRVAKAVRDYMDGNGFLEIETPFLIRSTPEGARDYLVPSRLNPGQFYALPQSPQYFKQLLMISGFDRYFQIVRCFRDEDLRADRQPEFTQIDIEMSFPQIEELFALIEGLMVRAFRVGRGIDIPTPLPTLELPGRHGPLWQRCPGCALWHGALRHHPTGTGKRIHHLPPGDRSRRAGQRPQSSRVCRLFSQGIG